MITLEEINENYNYYARYQRQPQNIINPKDIFLIECNIAGTFYSQVNDLFYNLQLGDKLELRREPENTYDHLSISIYAPKNFKLGYIPKANNEIIARLLDGGKAVYAVIKSKEIINDYIDIIISLFYTDKI